MYLASACDRVVMHPAGELTLAGFATSTLFYKGAMDRLGVEVQLVRIAEYKGAMEPFIMTEQSEPVRRNRNELMDDVYARVLGGIAAGRASAGTAGARAAATLRALVDTAAFTPVEANARSLGLDLNGARTGTISRSKGRQVGL